MIQSDNYYYATNQKKNNFAIITIDYCKVEGIIYLIICFDECVIIIDESDLHLINNLFYNSNDSSIFILNKNASNILLKQINSNDKFQFKIDSLFENFLDEFLNGFQIKQPHIPLWNCIKKCISAYLLRKSLFNSKFDRIQNCKNCFNSSEKVEIKSDDEYIKIAELGFSDSSEVKLIYHIEKERLFALKIIKKEKLFERECENYLKIHHPFISRCFGHIKSKISEYLILEYIEGFTLFAIPEEKLDFKLKIKIVFQIMITLDYLHRNNYIYRDLKPTNLFLDPNKTIVFIDFDRMIQNKNKNNDEQSTKDFGSKFIAPEIVNGSNYSFSSDIYSLGMVMKYLFFEKGNSNKYADNQEYIIKLQTLIADCTKIDMNERPNIIQLIDTFYYDFFSKVYTQLVETDTIKTLENSHSDEYLSYLVYVSECDDPNSLYELGKITKDIKKRNHYFELAANKNHQKAQINLGNYYSTVKNNTNKALYYYTLAAKQNNLVAYIFIGYIYYSDPYLFNINKAIYYFTLAANQDSGDAQYILGYIYYEAEVVERDIPKSIHFLSLAAEKNHKYALLQLGIIYYTDEFISRDLNKAIEYLTRSSDQNEGLAQFILGEIYSNRQYHCYDINKAIHFYTLSASQNDLSAANNLAIIYYDEQHIPRDINKAIFYFKFAADQGNSKSQFNIALIYYSGIDVPRDINKSIYYFTCAANQNISEAQYYLGTIYYLNTFVPRNMKLALFYLELAARQYHIKALNSLGVIYCQGKLVQLDANRGLSYLSRAADLGNIQSLYNLSVFYYQGNIVSRDINRSIYYLSQCLNQNFPNSELFLGLIYYEDMNDINKAIKYFTLGANQNKPLAKYYLGKIYYFESQFLNLNKAIYYLTDAAASIPSAQFWLAIIYSSLNNNSEYNEKFLYYLTLAAKNDEINAQMMLEWFYYIGMNVPRNVNKAIDLLSRSSKNGQKQADFILGYIYQVENDASKSISHYKEASSFNDQYAKNNLGVIYKNGFGEFGQNIGLSIEYFNEAIRKYDDLLSMYNLANMYLHEELIKNSIDKSIELLMNCCNASNDFYDAFELLCLVLVKKFGLNFESMQNEVKKYSCQSNELFIIITRTITNLDFGDASVFDERFSFYKDHDLIYNHDRRTMPLKKIKDENEELKACIKENKDITSLFYEGFGL